MLRVACVTVASTSYQVDSASDRLRLDRFLRNSAGLSTRQASAAQRSGRLLVNGRRVGSLLHFFVKSGDSVALAKAAQPAVEDWARRVLYEDDSLLVVDKPAGLPSVPGGGTSESALACAEALLRSRDAAVARLFPLHRLDKETSGVLCLAKDAALCDAFSRLFRSRAVEKTYWAVLSCGAEDGEAEGEWRDELASRAGRARAAPAAEGGKPCRTLWRREEVLGRAALYTLRPLTGRMHQLRAQAALRRTPVLGDDMYGRVDGRLPAPPRLCLHCARMEMELPEGGRLVLEAPLPAELAAYHAALRRDLQAGAYVNGG